jgi:hypothetical protein
MFSFSDLLINLLEGPWPYFLVRPCDGLVLASSGVGIRLVSQIEVFSIFTYDPLV